MAQYAGILNMDGLDSFTKIEPREDLMKAFTLQPGEEVKSQVEPLLGILCMRARFNEGSHAVPFVCELEDDAIELMDGLEDRLWKAQVVLRNSTKFGIAQGFKFHWDIIKRLQPELQGEVAKDRYQVRTLKSLQGV